MKSKIVFRGIFLGLLSLVLLSIGIFTLTDRKSGSNIATEPLQLRPMDVREKPAIIMPTIYIDQIITPPTAENRRELYTDLLSVCQQENVSIQPLSEKEISRIGTIRLQRWIDQQRTAFRLEKWDFELAQPHEQPHCHFNFLRTGRHELIEAIGLRGVNFENNQTYQIAPLSNVDKSLLLRTSAREEVKSTDVLQQVAGQPCLETILDETAVCTWVGGTDWGFEPYSKSIHSIMKAHHYELFRSFILQQHSTGDAMDTITTETFDMGKVLDEQAMQPTP